MVSDKAVFELTTIGFAVMSVVQGALTVIDPFPVFGFLSIAIGVTSIALGGLILWAKYT